MSITLIFAFHGEKSLCNSMIFESSYFNSPVGSNVYLWNEMIWEDTPLSTSDFTVESRSWAPSLTSQLKIVHSDKENEYRAYSSYMICNSRIGSNRLFVEATRIESDRMSFLEKWVGSKRIGLEFLTSGSNRIVPNQNFSIRFELWWASVSVVDDKRKSDVDSVLIEWSAFVLS